MKDWRVFGRHDLHESLPIIVRLQPWVSANYAALLGLFIRDYCDIVRHRTILWDALENISKIENNP